MAATGAAEGAARDPICAIAGGPCKMCAARGVGIPFFIVTKAMKDERLSLAARDGTSGSFIASPSRSGPVRPVAPGLPGPHEEITSKVRHMHASAGWGGLSGTCFENTPGTTPSTFPYETVTSAQQQFTYWSLSARTKTP